MWWRFLLWILAGAASLLAMSSGCGEPCSLEGQKSCAGQCVNILLNSKHCGGCGQACKANEGCSAGACESRCGAEETACGDRCVDTQKDPRHCGACDKACLATESCQKGACVQGCPSGLQECKGECANLLVDRRHCGACDNACPAGSVCEGGKCKLSCAAGHVACGELCVNPKISPLHCGRCDRKCEPGFACSEGQCELSCQRSQTVCGASCVDTQKDNDHCGACDAACPAGRICRGGSCELVCPAGTTRCAIGQGKSACIDTAISREHCGGCQSACKAGQICTQGACKLSCQKGLQDCEGACVDVQANAAHCGDCKQACKSGEVCQSGSCTLFCQTGWTNCQGSCVNLDQSPQHCGGCGQACKAKESCVSGSCKLVCPQGQRACSGSCVEPQSDQSHCGQCGVKCGANQLCYKGKCTECRDCPALLKQLGGFASDAVQGVAVDAKGNQYVVGYFSSPLSLGTTKLTPRGDRDAFVARLDASGNYVWAKALSSSESSGALDVGVDAKGEIYVTGYFSGTGTFGAIQLASKGSNDAFLAKLDAQGKLLWVKQMGSASSDYAHAVAVSPNGETVVAGYYYQTLSLSAALKISSRGSADGFLVKHDAKGNPLWLHGMGGTSSDYAYAVAIDGQGRVAVAGNFYGTATVGASSLSSKGSRDIFVGLLDKAGKWLWVRRAGGSNSDYAYALAFDASGRLYLGGDFSSSDADFGSLKPRLSGSRDGFVAQISAQGSFLWLQRVEGAYSRVQDLNVSSAGVVYATGYFSHRAQIGTIRLVSPDSNSFFLATLDAKGAWTSALQGHPRGGSNSHSQAYSVDVDAAGNVYLGGYFEGIVDFGLFSLTTFGGSDGFVAKYPMRLYCPRQDHAICGKACHDIAFSTKHCGACQRACGSGLYCVSRQCRPCTNCPQWVAASGGEGTTNYGLALDPTGHSVVAGSFYRSVSFGAHTLSSANNSTDIYVARLDPAGKWLWAKGFGSNSTEEATSVATDSSGNIYVAGFFYQSFSAGSSSLTYKGRSDAFVLKLDSSGKVLWAASGGGSSHDQARAVAVDGSGNVYIAGYASNGATFGSHRLSTQGYDVFVAKLDKAGKWLWAKSAGSSGSDYAYGIAVDGKGDAYVTGRFYNTASFGAIKLASKGSSDIFAAKIDGAGAWKWAAGAGGSSSDYGYAIAVDAAGSPVVTGSVYNGTQFGSLQLPRSNRGLFVARLDAAGKWSWAVTSSSTNDYSQGEAIAIDKGAAIVVTGYFNQQITLGGLQLKGRSSNDIFLARLTPNGRWSQASSAGGYSSDYGRGIALNDKGELWVSAYVNSGGSFGFVPYDAGRSTVVARFQGLLCPMDPHHAVCAKTCVNTQSDPQHCGRCNQKCAAGKTCKAGSCS